MAPVAGVMAHGGLLGAIAEGSIALLVAGVLVAVWLRERRARGEGPDVGPAELSDDE